MLLENQGKRVYDQSLSSIHYDTFHLRIKRVWFAQDLKQQISQKYGTSNLRSKYQHFKFLIKPIKSTNL